jgi:hypothetical protein
MTVINQEVYNFTDKRDESFSKIGYSEYQISHEQKLVDRSSMINYKSANCKTDSLNPNSDI